MDILAKVCSEQQYVEENVNSVGSDEQVGEDNVNSVKGEPYIDINYRTVKRGGITYVSCHKQCEYVFHSSSSSGRASRCTHSTWGSRSRFFSDKKYCYNHSLTMKTTKTPAKRTTKRKALPHNLPAHNCILCRTRSPSIIGRVTPTDNLSSNFESGLQAQIIRQQQQQLIILRHASKCPYPAGKCPVLKQCGSMKTHWNHIMKCKSQNCSTPHCASSRYLLSHYSNCKEETCPVCGPVKAAIQRRMAKLRQSRKRPYEAGVVVVEETW